MQVTRVRTVDVCVRCDIGQKKLSITKFPSSVLGTISMFDFRNQIRCKCLVDSYEMNRRSFLRIRQSNGCYEFLNIIVFSDTHLKDLKISEKR